MRMKFPSRTLLAAVAVGVLLFFLGLPLWSVALAVLLLFLSLGGWRWARPFVRTLPRDLKLLCFGIAIMHTIKKKKKSKTTVPYMFSETAAKHPDKTAILFEDQKWTFKELDEYANKVANFFRSRGLQRGDTVALFVENCPEFIGLWLGLGKLGVVSAFINYNLRREALAHSIRIVNASAVVFSASSGDALSAVLPELDPALSDACYCVRGESTLAQAKSLDAELQSSSHTAPPLPPDSSFADVLCYIYTSGTTGLPKACTIKSSRFYAMLWGIGGFAGVKHTDIVYCTLPLYHTSGGVLAAGQMIIRGTTLVVRKKFSASNFWDDCIKYKCTVVFYIGELCRYLLVQPKRPSDSQHCVRLAIGNGLRAQIWEVFQKRFQISRIAEFYGCTEGNAAAINTTGKIGSCGPVLCALSFLNSVRLLKVDAETGELVRDSNGFCVEAEVNEPGELVGRIMPGREYDGYKDKAATQKKILRNVFKPGDAYFNSGDLLRMDEEGNLFFCDRTGDTFRWKGENVSTTEVESTVANMLDLRDVIVYGVEIPATEGRAGMAAVAGNEETADIQNLAQRLALALPRYAVPIFIRLIEAADLTGTFKLQKVHLRREGVDLGVVSDPIYMLDPVRQVYVPFTQELSQQLVDGSIRV